MLVKPVRTQWTYGVVPEVPAIEPGLWRGAPGWSARRAWGARQAGERWAERWAGAGSRAFGRCSTAGKCCQDKSHCI